MKKREANNVYGCFALSIWAWLVLVVAYIVSFSSEEMGKVIAALSGIFFATTIIMFVVAEVRAFRRP